MATFTCHKPHHVFDVVPADVCAAVILATASALTQVRKPEAGPELLPAYQSPGWSPCLLLLPTSSNAWPCRFLMPWQPWHAVDSATLPRVFLLPFQSP